mmetsp:Transcript_24678/g.63219  ORF Transcript_24678/g.63219 Transcript_24678/m.63219 type:complete len:211 (-) Transcript_24678:85-717(-)
MRDSLAAQVGQSAQQLLHHLAGVAFRVGAPLAHRRQQVSSTQQLGEDVQVVRLVEVFAVREQVGVVQLLQDMNLSKQQLALSFFGNDLAGPLLSGGSVDGQSHGGESARAEDATKLVSLAEGGVRGACPGSLEQPIEGRRAGRSGMPGRAASRAGAGGGFVHDTRLLRLCKGRTWLSGQAEGVEPRKGVMLSDKGTLVAGLGALGTVCSL